MILRLLQRRMKRSREGSKTCGECRTQESWPPAADPIPKSLPSGIWSFTGWQPLPLGLTAAWPAP